MDGEGKGVARAGDARLGAPLPTTLTPKYTAPIAMIVKTFSIKKAGERTARAPVIILPTLSIKIRDKQMVTRQAKQLVTTIALEENAQTDRMFLVAPAKTAMTVDVALCLERIVAE